MDLPNQLSFNEIPALFDELRPRYSDRLIEDVIELSGIPKGGRILEVGPGTGIATLPFAERGYEVVGVELGAALARFARRKLAGIQNVRFEVSRFEDWELPKELFDLVMSATAWHWIDPTDAYAKAAKALRPGGALAIFRYRHAAGGDQAFFEEIQECYLRYVPDADPEFRLPNPENYQPGPELFTATDHFDRIQTRTYVIEETYTADRFVGLLSTFSNHRSLADELRTGLFDCIRSKMEKSFGGRIRKIFLFELGVARRAAR